MKKWEYLIIERFAGAIEILNKLGEEGWEMIAITNGSIVFKRPKENEKDMD